MDHALFASALASSLLLFLAGAALWLLIWFMRRK